jgi:4'-phosphopantetheinyl transferase
MLRCYSPVRWVPASPRPRAPLGEAHLWRVWLDRAGWPGAQLLPDEDRRRAASIRVDRRRRRWVAARWALRQILSGYLGARPADLEIELGAAGKPRLSGFTPIRFNLTHSAGMAVVAVTSEREIGIDVERIRRRRPGAFYRDWSRREAIAKCAGTGLGSPAPLDPMWVVEIDPGGGWAGALALSGRHPAPVRHLQLGTGG